MLALTILTLCCLMWMLPEIQKQQQHSVGKRVCMCVCVCVCVFVCVLEGKWGFKHQKVQRLTAEVLRTDSLSLTHTHTHTHTTQTEESLTGINTCSIPDHTVSG